jgi:hypothetical protein
MRPSPRTHLFVTVFVVAYVTATPYTHAQQSASAQRTPKAATKQSAKSARGAGERELKKRQQSAAASIIETAESARDIENDYFRVTVLALAADALWPFDELTARSLLTRAWEAATAFEKRETEEFDNEEREAVARGEPAYLGSEPEDFTQARQYVISAAARLDARLTEQLIKELRESVASRRSKDEQRTDEAERRHNILDRVFSDHDFDQLRLNLSRSLIDEGDYKQAAAVVAPEIRVGFSTALVRFLIQFRETAPTEADALYLQLLGKTASDPNADANDVLLLSSYVFTPRVLAVVDAGGSVNFDTVYRVGGAELTRVTASAQMPANVRESFFDIAAAILLHPSPPRAPGAPNARGERAAIFFAIARLMPFFERDAPRFAPQLHARQQSLAAEMEAASRDSLSSFAGTDDLAPDNPIDPMENILNSIKKISIADGRDSGRLSAVERAAHLKLWDRARTVASEIEDAEKRAAAFRLIAVFQVTSVADAFADDEDGDERAAQFVQNADVPPLTRSLGYARTALLASRKGKKARASELLGKAQMFAEQTDAGTEERVVALLIVAMSAEQFDAARAWPLVPSIVRAVNEVRNVSPDEISGSFIATTLNSGGEDKTLSEELSDFRLDTFFAAMARHDFSRALAQARSLTNAPTRSLVVISVARGALTKSLPTTRAQTEVLRRGGK